MKSSVIQVLQEAGTLETWKLTLPRKFKRNYLGNETVGNSIFREIIK